MKPCDMTIGKRVKTPDGWGTIMAPIGKPPDEKKPILVKLDKMIFPYSNFYYSELELR